MTIPPTHSHFYGQFLNLKATCPEFQCKEAEALKLEVFFK